MQSIAVFLSNRINSFFVSIPRMIFWELPPEENKREIILCARQPGAIEMEGDMYGKAHAGLEAFEKASMILVPYWPDPHIKPCPELLDALRAAHERGQTIVALCRGSFVLGYSGLLNGKRAATHWGDAVTFRELFPEVKLDENVLYVEDSGITTSAGIAAGIDCCLHVLRNLDGAKVANQVARLMVAPPFREGGQTQFISEHLPTRTSNTRINAALELLQSKLGESVNLGEVAKTVAMSERTFFRTFKQSTGMTPYKWLSTARLKRAQERLELTHESIETIARDCGFESPTTFRERFRESFGVPPSAWRRSFGEYDDVNLTS